MGKINEETARLANEMNSFDNYVEGSATAEYQSYVNRAKEIAEKQKAKVDPRYHEKIDALLNKYICLLAKNMNKRFSIESRVPSILIAGGDGFSARKKEKQNLARKSNFDEWQDIQKLLDKIRSIGMGGISADDPQAIEKLQSKLDELEKLQAMMKDINAFYRKNKTLEGCPNITPKIIENIKRYISVEDKPYPTWVLANNNAEIRRLKKRINDLTQRDETTYAGWKFNGGKVEMNKQENRLQVFFEEKPDEDTRTILKKNGFHWSPKVKAWQRQLTDKAIYAAKNLACICPTSKENLEN